MSQIKIGDKVERVEGTHLGMCIGDKAYVTGLRGNSVILDAYRSVTTPPGYHSANSLNVVHAAPELPTARKDDNGKLDMNLLDDMPRALKAVVEVMQWAVVDKKPVPYVRGSWLGVDADRYRAAIKRHERAAAEQATNAVPARLQRDGETNLLHLAHTACSAMMALENVLRAQEKSNG